MPAYDFLCQECGKSFEIRASMAEHTKGLKPACPACGSRKAVQTFTAFTVLTNRPGTRDPRGGCGPGSGRGCCGS